MFKWLLTFALLCASAFAQNLASTSTTFTAAGSGTVVSTIGGGITVHKLSYTTTGAPGAISIKLQGSNNGAFADCSGSTMTSTTSGTAICTGTFETVKIVLTTMTGGTNVMATYTGTDTLLAAAAGTGTAASQVQGTAATAASPVGNPVYIAGLDTSSLVRPIKVTASGALTLVINNSLGDAQANSLFGQVASDNGTAQALTTGNYCFNGATWDRCRGGTDGTWIGVNTAGADGISATVAKPQSNASGGLLVNPLLFNGTTLDRRRSASLANFPTSQTVTAANSIGATIAEKGARWTKTSAPAAGSAGSATIAAEASVRHVLDCVSWSANSSGAVTAANVVVQIRDGATGAGTLLWSYVLSVPTAAALGIQVIPPHTFCGLNLVGTTNTAMTVEFSAGVANSLQAINMSGFNVN